MARNNLARNTALLSFGAFLNKGINFVMVPLFSSWLSTSDYGIFDLLCTYASLLVPFISLASSEALFRFGVESEDIEYRTRLITASLTIDLFGYFLAASGILVLVFLFDWMYGICLLPLLLGELGMNHFQGVLRALKKLDVYSACSVVSTLLTGVFTTIFVLVEGMGLQGISYGYALGNIAGCAAVVFTSNYLEYIDLRLFSLGTVKKIVSYSLPLIPNNVSWWIINVSDRTLVGLFMGPVANGIYAIACKVPNFCSSVFGVFSISWQETASDMADSMERNSYYNYVFNTTLVTMLTLCAGVLTLNYPLFTWLFDSRYHEASYYAPILVTSVAINSLALYFGGIQISLKQPKENGITTICGAFVNAILNLILIPIAGLWAAAGSTLAANFTILVLRWRKLRSEIDFSIDRRTLHTILIYIYFFLMSYACNNSPLFLLNLLLSMIFFIWGNISLIKRIINTLKRRGKAI